MCLGGVGDLAGLAGTWFVKEGLHYITFAMTVSLILIGDGIPRAANWGAMSFRSVASRSRSNSGFPRWISRVLRSPFDIKLVRYILCYALSCTFYFPIY